MFLEQQMNMFCQDMASTKKSEDESVPMSVVEFLDAVEEPLKDQHLPEAKGKDSQDKRSFKVQFLQFEFRYLIFVLFCSLY